MKNNTILATRIILINITGPDDVWGSDALWLVVDFAVWAVVLMISIPKKHQCKIKIFRMVSIENNEMTIVKSPVRSVLLFISHYMAVRCNRREAVADDFSVVGMWTGWFICR